MTTPPPVNYSNYPLKDIPGPHPHDVLCGRGGGTNSHIGNSHWRMLVAANKQLYITLPKRQKMLLSRSIVNAVRSQNPPGRFLQKDSKTNKWFDVGDHRAQEKTSQALREGAPDIRKKVADDSSSTKNDVKSTSKDNTDDEQTETTAATSPSPEEEAPSGGKPNSIPSAPTIKKEPEDPAPKEPSKEPDPDPSPSPAATAGPSPAPAPAVAQSAPAPYGAMPHPMPVVAANGGMGQYIPHNGAPSGPHGPVYFNSMQPMQMYHTMVMNEQGIMVPGVAMMPSAAHAVMPHHQHQQQHQHQHQHHPHHHSQAGNVASNVSSNGNGASHHHHPYHNQGNDSRTHHNGHFSNDANEKDDYEPTPLDAYGHGESNGSNNGHRTANGDGNSSLPTFDEYVAAPPDGLDGGVGMSFGSVTMTDAEMSKLQATGASFGSVMSYRYLNNNYSHQQPYHHKRDSVESVGYATFDAPMMSIGSRLENGGTSFGTMMSYNTIPDGGLEAVGTSFGSLSLDASNRHHLFQQLELAAGGPEIPPMFNSEDVATGNLLECSDTESEDSSSKPQLASQKSAAWEKMQESVARTQLEQQQSRGTVGSHDLMPPPTGTGNGHGHHHADYSSEPLDMNGTILSVPTTGFQRDFSNISAWGDDNGYGGGLGRDDHDNDDDDSHLVMPPQLSKQSSDNDDALIGYLSTQQTGT